MGGHSVPVKVQSQMDFLPAGVVQESAGVLDELVW
jgi:hypothetical protein